MTENKEASSLSIEDVVAQCVPWKDESETNKEDYAEQQEYLSSILLDTDTNTSCEESLFNIIDQFFNDDEASKKLTQMILSRKTDDDFATCTAEKVLSLGNDMAKATIADSLSLGDDDIGTTMNIDDTRPPSSRTTNSKSPKRENRRQKKLRSPRKTRNDKSKSRSPIRTTVVRSEMKKDDNDNDLKEVVDRIKNTTDQDLDDLDDFGSAWNKAQADGRAWGGRGFGGRGVNRGLGTHCGNDAVIDNLTLTFSGRDLLTNTHLVFAHKHRYGLWGKNGVGKSTLLRRIAENKVPGWPQHLRVKMVNQEVLGSSRSVRQTMLDIEAVRRISKTSQREDLQTELEELEKRLTKLADAANDDGLEETSNRMADIYDELETIDVKDKKNSASSDDESYNNNNNDNCNDLFIGFDDSAINILKGLQFLPSMLDTPVNDLSGGWRMRVSLAETLYAEPDIMLLDEPTNHLDASATIFLEDYILEKELTIVVVSHDGHFLDAVCTDMIKFENLKLTYHVGDYSTFRDREEQTWNRNRGIAEAVARKEKKAMTFINKQKSMSNSKRVDPNKQRQAKEREKKFGRIGLYNEDGKKFRLLSPTAKNKASHINGTYKNSAGFQSLTVDCSTKSFGDTKQMLNFCFPSASPLNNATGEYAPLITMDECKFRYDDKDATSSWLLDNMTLNVSVGSRIAIIGKNGAGKSTLVKLLCNELSTKGGTFRKDANLKVAHIAQHHIEHLGQYLECTPIEYFLTVHDAKNEHEIRSFLGRFGLVGSLALQLIGTLSGGQKARLAFATVMYNAPHVIILDEPTNHLDGDSLDSLVVAVSEFEGAVVMVSHNQHFLSKCSKEMWTVADGKVTVDMVNNEEIGHSFNDHYGKYKDRLRKEYKRSSNKRKTKL